MTTSTGAAIKASKDHRFLTTNGWLRLEEIMVGDEIYTIGAKASEKTPNLEKFTIEEFASELWRNTDYAEVMVSSLGRVMRRHEVVKQTLNNTGRFVVSVKAEAGWKTTQVSRLVAKAFIEGSDELNVLHNDDCPTNNRLSNLRYGTIQDNHDDAAKNGRRAVRAATTMVVESIELAGEEMTYDIEVTHPEHNFIANGFCTHNSFNELSARYRELPAEFYIPEPHHLGKQNADNKQMRDVFGQA